MPYRLFRDIPYIESFPKDNHPWRVDWFGPVSNSPKKEKEHDIQIQLSPFIGDPQDPTANNAVASKQHLTRHIGVGLLPYVHIGSIWENGVLQPIKKYQYSSWEVSVNISKQTTDIRKPTDEISGKALISDDWHFICKSGKLARCLTIKADGVQNKLIIPQIELIRFYYIESTELAISVFSGLLRESSSYFDPLKNLSDHPFDQPYVFDIPDEFPVEDGRILSRLAASRLARQNASKIHDELVKTSVNEDYGHPATYPPFSGETTLKAHGKWIAGPGDWKFLVFWLDSCTGPFPFSSLTLYSNKIAPTRDGIDKLASTQTHRYRYRELDIDHDSKIRPEDDAHKNADKAIVELKRNRFKDLHKKKIIYLSKKTDSIRSIKEKGPDKKKVSSFSTDSSVLGEDSADRIFFTGSRDYASTHRFVPVSLHQFHEALKKLQDEVSEFTFKLITVTNEVFHDNKIGPLQYVPFRDGAYQLRWAYCDIRNKERRRILLAETIYMNRVLYFLEAERRKKKKDPSAQAEKLTVLMVYDRDFCRIDKESLSAVIQCCSEKGYMYLGNEELVQLGRKQIRHTWTLKKPEEIADRLRREMDKVIGN